LLLSSIFYTVSLLILTRSLCIFLDQLRMFNSNITVPSISYFILVLSSLQQIGLFLLRLLSNVLLSGSWYMIFWMIPLKMLLQRPAAKAIFPQDIMKSILIINLQWSFLIGIVVHPKVLLMIPHVQLLLRELKWILKLYLPRVLTNKKGWICMNSLNREEIQCLYFRRMPLF